MNLQPPTDFALEAISTKCLYQLCHVSNGTIQNEFLGFIKQMSFSTDEILLIPNMYDFYLCSYCIFSSSFFYYWFSYRIYFYICSARRTLRSKRCKYNNKDENNSPNALKYSSFISKMYTNSRERFIPSVESVLYFLFNPKNDLTNQSSKLADLSKAMAWNYLQLFLW